MKHRFFAVGVWSVFVAAGLAWAATGRERHQAIYPAQKIPLAFSHQQHLTDKAVECVTCHDAARKSQKASQNLLPTSTLDGSGKRSHPECENCHDIDSAAEGKPVDPPAACSTCHPGYDQRAQNEVVRASFPTANLIFNHQVHVERKVDCVKCHFSAASGTMDEVGLSTRDQLPKMETCLNSGCHDGHTAPSSCKTCHLTDASGRLQLTFSSGLLEPAQGDPLGLDHGPRYEFAHGTRAKLDRQMCSECHTESSCMTCHDSLQKPLSVHPNDFLTIHPVSARLDALQCDACHRFQSFCAACHERVGIGPDSDPSLKARNLKVHPNYAEWVDVPGPNHHSIAAARDIKQCISCHREESCLVCHATSKRVPNSRGTNPHPDGFGTRCRAMAAANDRACLKCHTDADLVGKGCR